MLCNGATSGIDALHLAADCIRAGRATRMIVVGVEVDTQAPRDLLGPLEHPLFNGALAVVLESEESARHRRIAVRGYLGPHMPHSRDGEVTVIKAGDCDCLLAPSALAARVDWPGPCIDITAYVGESYGAEGVIQLAVTLDELAARGYQRAVMLSGGKFGDASIARIEVKESL
jgi:3-oxoacyl-[acyl-carrier-protein] synthase II